MSTASKNVVSWGGNKCIPESQFTINETNSSFYGYFNVSKARKRKQRIEGIKSQITLIGQYKVYVFLYRKTVFYDKG